MLFAKNWFGAKAGDIYPTQFAPGDECPPELLEAATIEGVLKDSPKPELQAKEEPEQEQKRGRGRPARS